MGKDCNRLIRSFWNEVGPPEPSLEVNHTVRPSAEWIGQLLCVQRIRVFTDIYLGSLPAREKMRYAKHFCGDGGATVVAEKVRQERSLYSTANSLN